jgi:hypothetical protein
VVGGFEQVCSLGLPTGFRQASMFGEIAAAGKSLGVMWFNDLGHQRRWQNNDSAKSQGSHAHLWLGSPWCHLLPNYEICSKTRPVLPAFDFDNEPRSYLLVMTNRPLKGPGVHMRLSLSKGTRGFYIHLFSDGDEHGLILASGASTNSQLLADLAILPVVVIQMSALADPAQVFEQGTDLAWQLMESEMARYSAVQRRNYQGAQPADRQSQAFDVLAGSRFLSGTLNIPLLSVVDVQQGLIVPKPGHLEAVCQADRSRRHWLPFEIGELSALAVTGREIDEDSSQHLKQPMTWSDRLRRRFWPDGLAKTLPEDALRSPGFSTGYANRLFGIC